ncbi:uncharacterized protein ACRADG_010230 [Cochliomyia hominivorax]
MKSCLLCLQIITDKDKYIPYNSPQWIEFNIQTIIEKHLWPIDNSDTVLGVCSTCWCQLYDFHIFYTKIKDAQERNIKIDIEEPKLNKSEIECSSNKIVCKSEINVNSNESLENSGLNELITADEQYVSIPIIYEQNEETRSKGKRGRPPKRQNKLLIAKPKRKRGRPRKCDNDKPKTPPLIKRPVGRPPKKKVSEDIKNVIACLETGIPKSQMIANNLPISLQDKNVSQTKDIKPKTSNLFSNLRRRKRSQQHKTLMRNYIATSVRCMEFVRK